MKSKILSLIFVTAFLLSLTLASAAISFTASPTSITFTKFSNTTAVTITTIQNGTNITLPSTVSLSSVSSGNVTVSVSSTTATLNTSSATTVTLATIVPTDIGTYTGSLFIYNSQNATDNQTITITFDKGLCSVSNNGNDLVADDMEINVKSGFGEDDDFLYPLDEVEAVFNLDNQGNFDLKNIEITACLLEIATGDCILDEEDMEVSDDSFDLDSGDDVDVTLTFEIDPDKLDGNDNSYALYVGATGEIIDDTTSGTYDGDLTCSSNSEDIDIITNDEFVIINNLFYTESVNCGEMLDISADLFNVGDTDLDDDEVYFSIYNKELGIDQEITFDSGIDSMSQESVSFSAKIPQNITEKVYNVELLVLDHKKNVMENKEDDKSQKTIYVTVGKCSNTDTSSSVSITAELSADTPKAVIGEQFVVESTIKNTGISSATYTVSVSGNEAWSEVSSIEPSTFTLASGESREVSIYFNVDSDAKAGDKEFTIKTAYGSKTSEQKVAITVEEGLSSSKIIQHLKDNSFVYTIVLVNLILLIAIIIVVVKMFGRKSSD